MSNNKKASAPDPKLGPRVSNSAAMISTHRIAPEDRRAVWIVVGIAGSMFLIEMVVGHYVGSHALQADALDFLHAALTYGPALAAVGANIRTRAAALARDLALCLVSLSVLCLSAYHMFTPHEPVPIYMGAIGLLAVGATILCRSLLSNLSEGSLALGGDNLASPDAYIGNGAVVVTALAVWLLGSAWPDLLVGALASALFLRTGLLQLRTAFLAYRD